MTNMSKDEALELIQGVRATALLGLVLRESFEPDVTAELIRGQSFAFERNGQVVAVVQLDRIAEALEDPEECRTLKGNLGLLLKQTLVRTSFEIVKAYAEDTSQITSFQTWPAYDFIRLIRNTLSHRDHARLHRWSPGNLQSATWRHRTLTPQEVGTDILLEPAEYLQMQGDLYSFLRDQLS
jgi:hypothetical protein